MKKNLVRNNRAFVIFLFIMAFSTILFAQEKISLKLIAKPADNTIERRAQVQPSLPDSVKEIPFIETVLDPIFTEAEKQRGYVLFQRPITEVIYPNTKPLSHERIESLSAFGAPGEFEPVTFALYPIRAMQNLKVRVSQLACKKGKIPADRIDARLVTFWNIGYPAYTTINTFRRMPELIENVTVHSSPEKECQRYWITIHVPENAKPGLYTGNVTIWDDGFDKALEIPLSFRVLDFKLKKDPNKHYSAYYYVRDKITYKDKSEEFIRKAMDNDYKAMTEFGMDIIPTFYFNCNEGKLAVSNMDELEKMKTAGLKGPVPICGDNAIAWIYKNTTPNGISKKHWSVDPMPSQAFYDKVTEIFKEFEKERKAKGWPEFICAPIDEVDANYKEFGIKVYAAVKASGMRTYATKDPCAPDAADYAPYLDIWCSQPFSVPYEKIVSQNRYEYWCYPNHNACEIRDPQTMCKGGRMTYGFGLWRSGYTTLIPWHWSWTTGKSAMDYLRGSNVGCGQRIGDDATVIPTTYWSCFREGCDDGRYIYTLQQAIAERQKSKNPKCVKAVDEANKVLQETWNAINVQQKYLVDNMWPSEEFNMIRWRIAEQISRLLAFSSAEKTTAPSVIVAETSPKNISANANSPLLQAEKDGKLEIFDLLKSGVWENVTAEGKLENNESAKYTGKTGLRWNVAIDYKHDGGGEDAPIGQYLIGWPRIRQNIKPNQLDMTKYDILQLMVRIDSDRDEVADDYTPVGITVSVHGKKSPVYEIKEDLGDRQRMWLPLRFSVKNMIVKSGLDISAWKSISQIQFWIAEEDYKDGSKLIFDIGEVSLIRPKQPLFDGVNAPRFILLPQKQLVINLNIIGAVNVTKGNYFLSATLEDPKGKICAQSRTDLAESSSVAVLSVPQSIKPGTCVLHLRILDSKGAVCSDWVQEVTALNGPLVE